MFVVGGGVRNSPCMEIMDVIVRGRDAVARGTMITDVNKNTLEANC